MRLVEQSWEFIDEPDPIKKIELAGRTCYKSEDKITNGSALKFFNSVLANGHHSVIEHATFAFAVPHLFYKSWDGVPCQDLAFLSETRVNGRHIISGNLRAWREALQKHPLNFNFVGAIKKLQSNYPNLVADLTPGPGLTFPFATLKDPHEFLNHCYPTVRIITNRGVTHEIVRHRPASYSQESTRYINYSSKDILFVKPVWELSEGAISREFIGTLKTTEEGYQDLSGLGWPPQQAREVLPNALKTEIVMTCNLREWHHFFTLRCSKAAHPQMRALALAMLEGFWKRWPEIFDYLFMQHIGLPKAER